MKTKIEKNELQNINKRFAHLCKYYRSRHKLSTLDLAKKLNCSKSMVESYESVTDERGPAKSYETILRLSSGLDLSPIAFLHILEGRLNEQNEPSELNKEISIKLKSLTLKSVGHLLFILEKKNANDILELAGKLATKNPSYLEKISSLLGSSLAITKSIFSVIETLLPHNTKRN